MLVLYFVDGVGGYVGFFKFFYLKLYLKGSVIIDLLLSCCNTFYQ